MNRLYYSELCPDTEPFIKELKLLDIDVELRNISNSLSYLKEFLFLRDHELVFKEAKEKGNIGIPLLVLEDGTLYLSIDELKDQRREIE